MMKGIEILDAILMELGERGCATEISHHTHARYARRRGHRHWWMLNLYHGGEPMLELRSNLLPEPISVPLADPNMLQITLVHLALTG